MAHATQLAKGSFIGCTSSKFTVTSSMSRAFSRGIYTALSVIDAGDASLRRIWNLIGFQNVCARIPRLSWIFQSFNRRGTNGEKEKEGNILKGKSSFPLPSSSTFFSFPRKGKKKERGNCILNRGTGCVFLAPLCRFLKKPDDLARRRGRVHVKSIYRLKRTPRNDVQDPRRESEKRCKRRQINSRFACRAIVIVWGPTCKFHVSSLNRVYARVSAEKKNQAEKFNNKSKIDNFH